MVLAVAAAAAPARAQALGPEPYVAAGGRLAVSGDVSITTGCAHSGAAGACEEDLGYFNYSDYEHSTLRLLRLSLAASLRASERVELVGEVRSENGERPEPYAMYVRVRPWRGRAFDVQAGRVPQIFGAFPRRMYAADNFLIGYPLAYQYLTSLRSDAVPANVDELLRMRGRGWLSNYSLGNTSPARGLPLVASLRWDTGIQAHGTKGPVDASVGVTTGTLGNPLWRDDNDSKQVAGRLAVRPHPGLVVGGSAARGVFLSNAAAGAAQAGTRNDFAQSAVEADVEYSSGYYLIRAEVVRSRWSLPTLGAPLTALAAMVEGRYKIRPGLYAAARAERLDFSKVTGATRTDTWDADVWRAEIGAGYFVTRNLQVKVALQHNRRDGGRVRQLSFVTGQVGWWF